MKNIFTNKNKKLQNAKATSYREMVFSISQNEKDKVFDILNTKSTGLDQDRVEMLQDDYGKNLITYKNQNSIIKNLISAFFNPFTLILAILAFISIFVDIVLVERSERNFVTVVVISIMVLVSGFLRFFQETKSGNAAKKLSSMIHSTTCVERVGEYRVEIPMEDVVVGDIIHLSAGDMIPADMRILEAKDLFISQSSLSGESEPLEKFVNAFQSTNTITELDNIAFTGTTVVSGSAKGVVFAIGNDTLLGQMTDKLSQKSPPTSFAKGVNSVSWLLIKFMLVMVPIVFLVNGFTKKNWMSAALFAISVAIGLTPEMLPMIVTTSLAKGSITMSKKKVIVKNLNSIQNLGAINILCTDKTGTLTKDKVELEYHLDIQGRDNARVLRHAFLNSYFQTGLKNLIDIAIIDRTRELAKDEIILQNLSQNYTKIDEIPFDFERRRMSVVVEDKNGKKQMITKGAVEEMLKISSFVEYENSVIPLTDKMKDIVISKVNALNEQGLRVICVAQKTNPSPVTSFSIDDEAEMVLIGYLAFLDPPKETTKATIASLKEYGVSVKILTGDNERVTKTICRQVGIDGNKILLGEDIENMTDSELSSVALETTIFAKVSPQQKARIVEILRDLGNTVGYMGDGINDALAMKASDVGISVDGAVDVAKESADVILIEKDLMVLEDGIIEGRKTYLNMIKYIKMTASSNFGNMFSVLIASAFLPFLPMAALHLIILNLIYDIACIAIPWDNVDTDELKKPKEWDASSISKFMIWFGPSSSIFDLVTYALMFFVICPAICGGPFQTLNASQKILFISIFQAGWFIESMWTQTLIIHLIRTEKIPFVQSRATWQVSLLTFSAIILLTAIPFTSVGNRIGLSPLPLVYFGYLALIIFAYMALVTITKRLYIRRYHKLL